MALLLTDDASLLYHGTGKRYHDEQLKEFNLYRHFSSTIHLTADVSTAIGYATQRSRYYADSPILLIVKTALVDSNLREDNISIVCEFLDPLWYKTFDVDSAACPDKFLKDLSRMQRLARRL